MNITMSDDIRHEINHNNNMRDGPAIVSRIFYSILQAPFTPVSVQMAIALKKWLLHQIERHFQCLLLGVFCLARIASPNKHIDSYNLGQPAFLPLFFFFFFSDGNMARFVLYANSY